MIKIRKYKKQDLEVVCNLVVHTYKTINKKEATAAGLQYFIDEHNILKHEEKLQKKYCEGVSYVAEERGKIVGIVYGRHNRLGNLFVDPKFQKKGIGIKLLKKFISEKQKLGFKKMVVRSSLYAVPFYTKYGFKKSTGIRNMHGLKHQPMKIILT